MNFNDYQEQAMSFRLHSAQHPRYPLLGIGGEVGELQGMVAKAMRDGMKEDYHQMVKKELGDILWMLTAIAADNNFSLQEVAEANIFKLTDRKIRGVLQGSGDNR